MISDATMRFGESMTTALLGLDALYAAESGKSGLTGADIERLVVLNMSSTHAPDPFAGYAEAMDRFAALRFQAAALPEPDRVVYYQQACDSAIAFAAWRSTGLDFADQIGRFLHVEPRPASDAELDELRGGMRSLLTEMGYAGDLPAQFTAWEARQRVPPDEIAGTLEALLADAWERTAELMEMPGEPVDGMHVETVTSVPYNAMCDFSRRLIRLNVDPILTQPGLKHLAVHEGYSGHYVQFKRRENAYRRGDAPADGLLSVVNTASSAPFEGIADIGMTWIGWNTSLDDRLSALLTRYRSAAGTRAAWRLHADNADPADVRAELLDDAIGGGEGWVDSRLRFLAAHDRAALIWSYWAGEPALQRAWQGVGPDRARRTSFFDFIYDRMHSVDTVSMLPA